MRFFLDHDVPASVGRMLRGAGHDCWTAAQAGLAAEGEDDKLSVYAAAQGAVLITLDREFSRRRLRNPIGWHIWLRCLEPEAAVVLSGSLAEVLALLHRANVTITVSMAHVSAESRWE